MTGHHLSLEDVSQVTAALGASDLHPTHAKRVVHMPIYGALDLCIECRPSTAGVKLCL